MSYYAVKQELSFDAPASTVTRANGGFGEDDKEVIGRWVQRDTGNTVILVDDNVRPLGVITGVTGTKVAVAVGPIVRGKRSDNAVLARDVRITGATRVVTSGGTAERGFIKAQTVRTASIANLQTDLLGSVGRTFGSGSAASTADTEPTSDQWEDVLMYG